MNWKSINSLSEWEDLLKNNKSSDGHTIAVFKHSTRCAISSMAKKRLELDWNKYNSEVPIYYVDLIAYRNLSTSIADTLGIVHQSPQLILIKDGKSIYDASHISISSKSTANYK